MRRRTLLFAFAAACLAALCSCGGTAASSEPEAVEEKVLHIGTTIFAPYFYIGEDGNYAGVDYEIALEACARMGYSPDFVTMEWPSRDRKLNSGAIDCIWSCFIMTGRENDYQWAGPYLTSDVAVVVSADSDISTVQALAGKTVAVRANAKIEDFFLTNDAAPHVRTLSTFSAMRMAFSAFGKGYADAVADHRAALEQLTNPNPELYRYLDEPLFTVPVGVGFSLDFDPAVVQALDSALHEMTEDGTIAAIAQKYSLPEQNDLTEGGRR